MAIGLFGTPAKLFKYSQQMALELNDPVLLAFTTGGSPSYDGRWMIFRLIETAGYGIGGIFSILLIGLFFCKHRFFPLAFTLYACLIAALNIGSFCVVRFTPTISERHQGDLVFSMAAVIAAGALWTGYLWYSRRAQLTFVRRFYFSPFFPFFNIA